MNQQLKIYNTNIHYSPNYATSGSAGIDLAAIKEYSLMPNMVSAVHTGVYAQIPHGYVGLLCLRSSTAKQRLMLANSVGVIDSDYRGEIIALIYNLDHETTQRISAGQRVAQLVVVPVRSFNIEFAIKEDFDEDTTERGTGGFGSTGSCSIVAELGNN